MEWQRRWSLGKNAQNEIQKAIFIDRKEEDISNIEPSKVYQSFISIGGENGWFDFDFYGN